MNRYVYQPNVIDRKFEAHLLNWLESSDLWVGVSPSKNARQVIHFGEAYSYKTNENTVDHPLPLEFEPLSCIINRYLPGQGIAPHSSHFSLFSMVLSRQVGTVYYTVSGVSLGHVFSTLFTRIPLIVRACSSSLYHVLTTLR